MWRPPRSPSGGPWFLLAARSRSANRRPPVGGGGSPSIRLTIEALKAHAARQADEQTRCESWSESGYIFTTEDGQPLDPHRISKAFERHLREAALPRIPLHGLRHTYATLALSSGVNPRIVSGDWGTRRWP